MTGYVLISSALRLLKVLKWPGQKAAPEELADGLTFLNNLLDSWSIQRILIPVVDWSVTTLTAGQYEYQIGPSAPSPFNIARPIRIDAAGIVQASSTVGTVAFRTPLKIISQKEWVEILDKTTTADVPEKLYYGPEVPLGTLWLWPIPNCVTATELELSAWTALASFPDSTSPGTDVPLAPGYARALIYNLALDLESTMPGAVLDAADAKAAQEAKQYVMELNSEMVPQLPDTAIPPLTSAPFEPVPSTLKAVAQAKFGGGGVPGGPGG